MGTKTVGVLFRKQEKIIRYSLTVIWFAFITWAVVGLYPMMIGTNTQGDSCDPYLWQEGKIYQWVWGGHPCVYTIEFLFGYILYTQLYLLYDYVRRRIVGFNPNILWRMAEVGTWFALNWGYLLWLTATDYGILNLTMGWTSFVGTLLFFVPIILLAGGTYLLSNRAVIWTFFGMLMIYVGLVFLAMTREIM